jgi:hypothetical protein
MLEALSRCVVFKENGLNKNDKLNTFPSIREAARTINCSKNLIQVCLTGKIKTGKGFIWKKIT